MTVIASSGIIAKVEILKSTGSKLLDAKVIGAGMQAKLESIVKLLYYPYRIRKKLEIIHRLSRSTILYAYV